MGGYTRNAPIILDDRGPTEGFGELLRGTKMQRTGRVIPFWSWTEKVPEPKTGPVDLVRFPFQAELYETSGAFDEDMVVKKATQVGVSTWLLRVALYHADIRQKSSLYVFPKRQQMYDFADARIRAAIDHSPYLQSRIPFGYVQNKGLKRIGLGWLYCRGSESKSDLDSVDADVLLLDEYDTLRRENIPDAERRISGAPDGKTRRVGVPSVPGDGIDKAYNNTDMRRWVVKCGRCGEQQPVKWENVDTEAIQLICTRCHKGPLDTRKGEWVPEHPDADVKGYDIPRLIVPNVNLKAIVEASKATRPYERQVHMNKDLAIAWTPAEGRLSLEAILAASRTEIKAQADAADAGDVVTMGVDVKSVGSLHVRISKHHETVTSLPGGKEERRGWKSNLWLGELQSFGEVGRLIDRFNVRICVIDHLPEGRLARGIAESFPGRVFLCNFAAPKGKVLVPDESARTVSVNRTLAIDAVVDQIRTQRNLLPAAAPPGYQDHLQNMHRVVDEDIETGETKVEWRGSGDFDYLMAELYDLVAFDIAVWRTNINLMEQEEAATADELVEFERAALDSGMTEIQFEVPEYHGGFE
jgi:hypothetical protein